MFDLSGTVAVVTGGNGGIGLGMARGLARAGATLVVVGRDRAKSDAALAELRGLGAQAHAIEADVTDEASVQRMTQQAFAIAGRIDTLVCNAGTSIRKPVQDLSLDEWHTVMDTNLTSAFLCSRAAYPHLKATAAAHGRAKVIHIGSMMSIFGAGYAPAYGASKGGIVQLTRAQATGWAADRIQVNAVLPGWIDTALTRRAREQVQGLNERVLARTPAGRWGEPDDLSGMAVFLASAASDFVTGTAIPVDGGYSVAS
ncbi:MAG: SDR family NAD(P)-dependent oxidoreductase [Burkholderiaceae bacterium]|jgi:2-deoxy-D-gluconate 3-dehydrogenase